MKATLTFKIKQIVFLFSIFLFVAVIGYLVKNNVNAVNLGWSGSCCYSGSGCGDWPGPPFNPPCDSPPCENGDDCEPNCSCSKPDCDAGSSTTETGSYCKYTKTRNCTGDCDSTCSASRTCWWYETNKPPEPPTPIEYCVYKDIGGSGGNIVCKVISNSPSNPTVLAIPAPNTVVFIRVGTVIIPAGSNSRGIQYLVNVNNMTTSPSLTCATDPNDYCDTWGVQNRTKADLRNRIGIAPGRIFEVSAWARTLNRCTDGTLQSNLGTYGYFTFQNHPGSFSVTPNLGISGTETDADNGPACTDNNPQVFTSYYKDPDGCSDLRNVGFWISKDPIADYAPSDVVRAGEWVDSSYPTVSGVPGSMYGRLEFRNGAWVSYEGRGGNPASLITPINVRCSDSKTLEVQWRVTFTGTQNNDLDIYMFAYDSFGAMGAYMEGWADVGDWVYDGVLPTPTITGINLIKSYLINLPWTVDEPNASVRYPAYNVLTNVYGDAKLTSWGLRNGPVKDTTYNSSLEYAIYAPGSVKDGTILYNYQDGWGNTNLWAYAGNNRSGTESIDIMDNQGGNVEYKIAAVDKACNLGDNDNSLQMGEPWAATRGGLVYSLGRSTLNVLRWDGENTSLTPDSTFWIRDLYSTKRNDLELSSEFASSGGTIKHNSFKNMYIAENYTDLNVLDWYSQLSNLMAERVRLYSTEYRSFTSTSSVFTAGSTSSSVVGNSDTNLFHIIYSTPAGGTLAIQKGFVCNLPTVMLVNGNVSLEPNMTRTGTDYNGCIIVASGNISITGGDHLSAGLTSVTDAPKYDLVEAFLIANGTINMEFTDSTAIVRDGLKIHGGLVGIGNGGSKGIVFGRSLQLANNLSYPTEVIHADPRYVEMGRRFFGPLGVGYIRDIGFRE